MTLALPLVILVATAIVVLILRRLNAPRPVVNESDAKARMHRLLDRAEREVLLQDAAEERKASMARLRGAAANLEAAAEKRRRDKSLKDLFNELAESNRAMGIDPEGDW